MENNPEKFEMFTDTGEKIEMDMIFSFYSKNANKNYVFLTDNTLDDNQELNVYAYYISPDRQSLLSVEDEEELDTINKILEKYQNSKFEKEDENVE